MGLFSGAKNLVFGRKEEPSTYRHAPLTKEQIEENQRRSRLFGALEKEAMEPVDPNLIRGDIALSEKYARGAYDDQLRKTSDLIKQRGLGESSIGISSLADLSKGYSEKVADIRSSYPRLFREEKERRFDKLRGLFGMTSLQTPEGYMQQHAKRGGGLFGTVVEGAKAYAAVKGAGGGGK